MSEVDRMDLLEREECPVHGTDFGLVYTERGSARRCGHGERACGREVVTVRYVRATPGAVSVPDDVMAAMVNRFMWAVTTGPSHPDATPEKAVETIIAPLLDHLRGAVGDG